MNRICLGFFSALCINVVASSSMLLPDSENIPPSTITKLRSPPPSVEATEPRMDFFLYYGCYGSDLSHPNSAGVLFAKGLHGIDLRNSIHLVRSGQSPLLHVICNVGYVRFLSDHDITSFFGLRFGYAMLQKIPMNEKEKAEEASDPKRLKVQSITPNVGYVIGRHSFFSTMLECGGEFLLLPPIEEQQFNWRFMPRMSVVFGVRF